MSESGRQDFERRDFDDDPGVRWMLAYQRGDEAAFERLVETYSGQLYALFTRFLGPAPEREDLVQEVFLRVIRHRERWQPTARFSTWLYRIAFNISVNRTQRSLGSGSLGLGSLGVGPLGLASLEPGGVDVAFPADLDGHGEEPSASLERKDAVRAVRAAIASLPEAQRMALVLAKYHELPYADIAVVLRSSEKAVKSLVHRARENLRERLAPFLHQEEST
jgi:RNA polymerase sigma-70 factor, ECF subfamily